MTENLFDVLINIKSWAAVDECAECLRAILREGGENEVSVTLDGKHFTLTSADARRNARSD